MVDIEAHAYPCCQGTLHRIGEDVSERLDKGVLQVAGYAGYRPLAECGTIELAFCELAAPRGAGAHWEALM